jgi:virulence factor Mce-like protein
MSPVQDRITDRLTRERLGLETRRARRPFLLWLALLAGALVSFTLLLTKLHVPAPWTSQYRFTVAVRDATAVQKSNEVRIAGVPVGKVTGVRIKDGVPAIAVSIDPKYAPLYRDARVQVRPSTPLQNMYLDIVSRGSSSAGRVSDGRELAASQSESSVQVGQVIDIFDAGVRPRVAAAINTLGAGLGDHGAQLRSALVELAPFLKAARRLNRELAVRRSETRRLIHNFELLSAQLADRTGQVRGLVRTGAITMQRIASVGRPLGELIDRLPPTLRVLPRAFAAVRAAADQLDPAAVSLLPVAHALAPALASLERLSPVATTALAALDRPLPSLTALLRSATPLAGDLDRSFTQLTPQAPQLDRVTSTLVPCELAVQKFFQWTLSVSKLSGLQGDMQRGVGLLSTNTATGLIPGSTEPGTPLQIAPTCTEGGR